MENIIPTLTNQEIENAEIGSMGTHGNFTVFTGGQDGVKVFPLNIRDILSLLKNVCEKDVAKDSE